MFPGRIFDPEQPVFWLDAMPEKSVKTGFNFRMNLLRCVGSLWCSSCSLCQYALVLWTWTVRSFFLLSLLYFTCFFAVVKNKNCDRDQVSVRLSKRRTYAFDYHILHQFRSDSLLHYWQNLSDVFNFVQKKCPKIKPFEIYKHPKFLASEIVTEQYKIVK